MLPIFGVLFLLLISSSLFSQTAVSDSLANEVSFQDREKNKELDTDESLIYLSERLLFQVKKRLQLTTKAEELAEVKKQRKVVLNIAGVKIER